MVRPIADGVLVFEVRPSGWLVVSEYRAYGERLLSVSVWRSWLTWFETATERTHLDGLWACRRVLVQVERKRHKGKTMEPRRESMMFRFMHGKVIRSMQVGDAGKAAAWAIMLAHYIRTMQIMRGGL